MLRPNLLIAILATSVPLAFACSASAPSAPGDGDGDAIMPDDDDGITLGDGDGDGNTNKTDVSITTQPPTINCGDGILDDDEACDDKNQEAEDGCGSNCRFVEPGFVCPKEGEPCLPFAKCGDGLLIFPEQCDDGGLDDGDGCSANCKVELGYKCEGAPSSCSLTVCGDGQQEGSETCEANDGRPFDGCSLTCQAEPQCTTDGCTSSCGDGLVLAPEECDDGNATSGDGCSSTCQREPGYECTQAALCEGDDCILELPIVFRDFTSAHPDFGVSCGMDILNVASATLNAEGKPELVDGSDVCIQSEATFAEWYSASPNNAEIVSTIKLFPNGEGGYVNRFGEDGEQFESIVQESQTSSQRCTATGCCEALGLENEPWNCCEANDTTCRPCTYNPAAGCAQTIEGLDGNPLFFPIDGHPDALVETGAGKSAAKIPEEVYGGSWKWENPTCPDSDCSEPLHNFHFTSEIAYWFEYTEGMTADLTFIGDDDVWVYVNRRLAVDMGGLHVPMEGSFTLNANGSLVTRVVPPNSQTTPTVRNATAADFGMVPGGVYEIKVFHAERKITGSSFKLTLSGFNASRSECLAICGDGILAAGEQCDNGAENNLGGHNGCNADCTIGAYCGDGIVQDEVEQCDDAAPDAPSDCSGCRILEIR